MHWTYFELVGWGNHSQQWTDIIHNIISGSNDNAGKIRYHKWYLVPPRHLNGPSRPGKTVPGAKLWILGVENIELFKTRAKCIRTMGLKGLLSLWPNPKIEIWRAETTSSYIILAEWMIYAIIRLFFPGSLQIYRLVVINISPPSEVRRTRPISSTFAKITTLRIVRTHCTTANWPVPSVSWRVIY